MKLTMIKAKHFDRSLFFGLCYFLLSLLRTNAMQGLLMIVAGYFCLLVYVMEGQLNKMSQTQKRKGRAKEKLHSLKTHQTFSACLI
jgi:hypothetical protein